MTRYLKRHRLKLLSMFVFILTSALVQIQVQFIKGTLLDLAVSARFERIWPMIFRTIVLTLVHISFHQLYVHARVRMTSRISRDIKNNIFEACVNRRLHDVQQLDSAAIVARYTTDLDMVESNFLAMGSRLFEFLVTILTSGMALVLIDYKIAILCFIVFIIPMFITNAFKNSISKAEENYVRTNKKHLEKLMKVLGGLEAIKNYSIEKEIDRVYGTSLNELTAIDIKRSFKRSLANGMSFFSTMFSQAAIILYSAVLLYGGELTSGEFVTVFSLVVILRPPFYWLSQLYESVIASRPAIRSIGELISSLENANQSNAVTRTTNAADFSARMKCSSPSSADRRTEGNGQKTDVAVDLEYVDFSYENRNLFRNFNLSVKPGQKVLITGKSGSGKTTLIKLITGALLPDSGTIRINGEFSYFTQDAFLFAASLKDNLTLYDPDLTDEEIRRVSKTCGIEHLLQDKKEISEHGSNLSGGERRRVALARTLLRSGDILILDEPLANLDMENVRQIEDVILDDREHTILIVSHVCSERLLAGMDRILTVGDEARTGDKERIGEKAKAGGVA